MSIPSRIKIEALVELAEQEDPGALEELKASYPELSGLLRTESELGGTEDRDSERIRMLLDLSEVGLRSASRRAGLLAERVRKRLVAANRVHFAAAVITVVCSSSVLVLIGQEDQKTSVQVMAALGLCAAAGSILSSFLKTSPHGAVGGLVSTYEELSELRRDAAVMSRRIELSRLLPANPESQVDIIAQSNEIAARLNLTRRQLRR